MMSHRQLQKFGELDTKTSLDTSSFDIGEIDGAIFFDRRDDHVFVYHNGEESYHAVRVIKAQKADKGQKQNIEKLEKYFSKLRIESKAK